MWPDLSQKMSGETKHKVWNLRGKELCHALVAARRALSFSDSKARTTLYSKVIVPQESTAR